MGLCGERKKKQTGKTIVIPRGLINPDEEAVIEIPVNLNNTSNLIVKAPMDASSSLTVEAYGRSTERSYRTAMDGTMNSFVVPSNYDGFEPQTHSSMISTVPPAAPVMISTPTEPDPPPKVVPTQPPPAIKRQICSSTQTAESDPTEPPSPTTAHSPICPICQQNYRPAACRPPPIYSCQPIKQLAPCKPPEPAFCTGPTRTVSSTASCAATQRSVMEDADEYRPCKQPYVFINYPKSDRFDSTPCRRGESAMLSKLLDEKIDKVLKPLLLTLAKSCTEDEREISPRDSYSCFNHRFMSVMKSGSRDLFSSSFESRRSWWRDEDSDEDEDYDDKYCKRLSKGRKGYDDKERLGQSKRSYEQDPVTKPKVGVCPTTYGCPSRKKASVNFDRDSAARAQESDTVSEKGLDLPRRERGTPDIQRRTY